MSKEEKWIVDIKEKIDIEIELTIRSLERLAVQNDVEVNYVLETYKNNIRINKIIT